jgi:template-activating factor I
VGQVADFARFLSFLQLVNHPLIGASVEKHDEQVLNHATSLDVTFVDDNGGFKIELKLKENPFVASKSLWKQVTFSDEDEATVTTSDIEWKTTDEAKEVAEHASFIQWFVSSEGEQDFAEFIKNEVWANPMPFYVNGESDDEDDDEDDEEGEGDDDDEEEADEEEAGDEDKE